MAMFSEGATKKRDRDKDGHSLSTPSPVTDAALDTAQSPICSRSQYPLNNYWTKQEWRHADNANRNTSDLDSTRGGARGRTRSAKGENVMMLYIEHIDGTPVNGCHRYYNGPDSPMVNMRSSTKVTMRKQSMHPYVFQEWSDKSNQGRRSAPDFDL
jgi:hypothetical protein